MTRTTTILSDVGGPASTPYVGGGIGFAYVDSDWSIGADLIVQKETIQLAWSAMGEFTFPLNGAIGLDLDPRYRNVGMADPELDVTLRAAALEADLEVATHPILVGIHLSC